MKRAQRRMARWAQADKELYRYSSQPAKKENLRMYKSNLEMEELQ